MKLLFENWRKYLNEDAQDDLESEVVALIRKYNLDKQDIKKLLALKEEEDPLNEAIGQDLANLYKKYGKQAIAGTMAAMIGLGAIAPQSAEAGMLDTGRAISTVVSNPSVVQDVSKMINLIKFQGDERSALIHLDNIIDTLGGADKAKALIDNAIDSDMLVSLALRSSKAEYKKNLERSSKRWKDKEEKWQAIGKLLDQYTLIDQNDDSSKGLKNVIAYRLGQDSADKVEEFAFKITAGMGWGSNAQEIEAYKNNLAQQISKIDGRPVDQIGYL
tara:strand:+ start:52 stop:873 length:822 start_codon:yes stop_codon:yes gene_type:complete